MKVGDLIMRKEGNDMSSMLMRQKMGPGLVLSKQVSGSPAHACITVLYAKTGRIYDMAESLVTVISESR